MELRARRFEPRDQRAVARRVEAFAGDLPDPRLIIKPARLGSSVGVSIVHRPNEPPELELAVQDAFRYDDLVHGRGVLDHARELEVAVLGNAAADLEVFGPGEIIPGREFYDFEAKYRDRASRAATCSARPRRGLAARTARAAARERFLAIGAEGFARVDFLLARDGALYVSEINTIPGFTPISLFPLLCAPAATTSARSASASWSSPSSAPQLAPPRRLTRADLP